MGKFFKGFAGMITGTVVLGGICCATESHKKTNQILEMVEQLDNRLDKFDSMLSQTDEKPHLVSEIE